MDISAFPAQFKANGEVYEVEIRPCCREDNVVDYAVWQEGKLAFTVTKNTSGGLHWVVALKNADDNISAEVVQAIGTAIENHYGSNS